MGSGIAAIQQEVEEVTQSAHHDSQVAAASTQTVHLTIPMLIANVSEQILLEPIARSQTMLGANRCCLEQIRLCRMCRNANTSEVDLTSGEEFPWKQLFKGIPLHMAQIVIGGGITKFTFRLLSEMHCFEITCLDGTQWRVIQCCDVRKHIAGTEKACTFHEFYRWYGNGALAIWQNTAPEEDTKTITIQKIGDDQILTCKISHPDALPMRPGYPPGLGPNPLTFNAHDAVQAPRVVMIGLSGPGGVGKSTLAKGLATKLESPMSPIEVNLFRQAKCCMPKKRDRSFNSETPQSINFEMLCDYLDTTKEALMGSQKVKAVANPDHRLPETIFVVVEGSLLFYNKKVCDRLHVHLWVDGDCRTCLKQRLSNDIRAGTETGPAFAKVFRESVWTDYLLHRASQLANVPAAVLLDGGHTAPQLLDSALRACQSATQPYSNTPTGDPTTTQLRVYSKHEKHSRNHRNSIGF